MTRDMKKLLRELDLPEGCPTADAKAVKRRVNAALNADPSERKLYMRQKMKIAAVLVAAVVALTGTALAVGPTLQELIAQALGSFAPYAQEVDGVSATDQGIEIKVRTAVADDVSVRVFLEVRDLKDSRISSDALSLSIDARRGEYSCGYGGDTITYDPVTHTAIYELDFRQEGLPVEARSIDRPLTLKISSMQPGYHWFNGVYLPAELPSDKTLSSRYLDTGEVVLVPNQTSSELEGTGGVALSSMGFASDGMLHIQLELPKGTHEHRNHLRVHMETEQDFEHYKKYNSETSVVFYENGTPYMDLNYSVTRSDMDDFEIGELYGSFHTADDIRGEWNLTVPLEVLPKRVLTINQPIGGTLVKTVSLTATSATVEKEKIPGEKARYGIPGLPLTLYGKDGDVLPVPERYDWIFDEAINPEDVTAIAIGMWYIPLEGDTALPGHWLSELPQ